MYKNVRIRKKIKTEAHKNIIIKNIQAKLKNYALSNKCVLPFVRQKYKTTTF